MGLVVVIKEGDVEVEDNDGWIRKRRTKIRNKDEKRDMEANG